MRTVEPAAAGQRPPARREPTAGSAWRTLLARGGHLAARAAATPYRATAALLALNAAFAGILILLGQALFADSAQLFRELMPGTWLSAAELLAVALIAWTIRLALGGPRRVRLDGFWGASVVVFCVLAFDELSQATIFLADLFEAWGAEPPGGFKDLDAFLLSVLLVACGAVLLRYARALVPFPAATALLAVGAVLGAASQGLDSTLPSSNIEFTVEELVKLAAEPFLIGGYLVILGAVIAGRAREARTPNPVEGV